MIKLVSDTIDKNDIKALVEWFEKGLNDGYIKKSSFDNLYHEVGFRDRR
jgi:Ca2+-binding EF-hand superfamily protein